MNLLMRQIAEWDISPLTLAAILGIAAFAYLVLYLLLSDALFFMARQKRISFSFIAWLPFIRLYLAGSLIQESIEIFGLTIPYVQVILPVFSILSRIFSVIPIFGTVLSVVYRLYQSIVFHKLFRLCGYKHPLIPSIAIFIIPSITGVFLFAKRKNFNMPDVSDEQQINPS